MGDYDYLGRMPPSRTDVDIAANATAPSKASAINQPAVTPDDVGRYYLPGVGETYLHPDFADKVGSLIGTLQSRGIQPIFASGYRDRDKQAGLQDDPNAHSPAKNSLHSAGRAVDFAGWDDMDAATRAQIVSDATAAGLSWGGNLPTRDFNHFYSDPGGDRNLLIDGFTQGINTLNSQTPDD